MRKGVRNYQEYQNMYNFKINFNTNNKYRQIMNSNDTQLYSFNPSLRKLNIELLNIPYNDWDDEFTIQTTINELEYFAVVTNNSNGYVRHIGWDHHIDNIDSIKYRHQFPDK